MESDKEVIVPEKEQTAGEIEAAFGDAFTEAADTAEKKPVLDVAEEVVEKDEPLAEKEVAKVEEPVKAAVVEEDPLLAKPVVKAVTAVEEPVKVTPPAPLDLKADPDFKEFFEEYDYLAEPILKMIAKVMAQSEASRPATADPADNKDLLQAVADYIHFDKITTAHSDFPAIRDSGALKRFVDSQTGAEKDRLEKIYTGGSSEEIISLVTEYKAAQAKPVTTGKNEKLLNMAAVKTKPTAINTASTGQAEDFDSAFDEAAAKK
jgi:hypothetical protein